MQWSAAAEELLNAISDSSLRHNTKMRAEKKALHQHAERVEKEHILPFVVNPKLKQQSVEKDNSEAEKKTASKCPFANLGEKDGSQGTDMAAAMRQMSSEQNSDIKWTQEALTRLAQIPPGSSQAMTKKATESIASQQEMKIIKLAFLEQILGIFSSASQTVIKSLPWDKDAEDAISKAPAMVQGMLVKEIEIYVKRQNLPRVERDLVQQIKDKWNQGEQFHLDPEDPRNQ